MCDKYETFYCNYQSLTKVVATLSGNSRAIMVKDATTNAASPTASIVRTTKQETMNETLPSRKFRNLKISFNVFEFLHVAINYNVRFTQR
jgi:hypothetical protein